ncbi:MAG: AAA family ATPase [Candidatus Woesearchaeota archaeon]
MNLFKDMLSSDQTLFKNPVSLDYDFLPKMIPHRENEQQRIATCIRPLFNARNGRNIIIFGKPGVGKTAACRHVLQELEEQTDDITPIYINCWQKNTNYKILIEMCAILNYKLTHNKKTDELLDIVVKLLNKKSAGIVFDEVDKVDNYDFLYQLLEGLYRKCIILITNFKEWVVTLDDRIKSRLVPEMLEFKPYTLAETRGILKERVEAAFYPQVFENEAFELIAQKTCQLQDVRSGLYLLKESATLAEDQSQKKVDTATVKKAISKLEEFKIRKSTELDDETRVILNIIKTNSPNKIGDLFKAYQQQGGKMVYKSFQRKVKRLEQGKYITVSKTHGGKEGSTTIVTYSETKKLTDF